MSALTPFIAAVPACTTGPAADVHRADCADVTRGRESGKYLAVSPPFTAENRREAAAAIRDMAELIGAPAGGIRFLPCTSMKQEGSDR